MFRFEDPIYLYSLVLIPLLALIRFVSLYGRKQKLRKFGDLKLITQLMPDVSRWRSSAKFWLLELALALLVVTLARPQMGTKISHDKRSGIETIIAMDISNSMLAEDVAPSRLDRSKMMVENLVDHFTNDKIGLIVFAGDAFVQLPITSDYVSAKMFLDNIDPSLIETQGTNIAAAIQMSTHSFTQEEGVGRAIIVITDGEDHEGQAIEAAKDAKSKGMRVYVLGVGSPKGAPIPVPGSNAYMKDNTGNTVMSALNEDMCKQIAEAGGGAYIHVDNNSAAQEQLDAELGKLAKKEISSTIYSDYDEQFQAVAILVLIALIMEICIREIKNPMLKGKSFFRRKKMVSVLLLLMLTVGISAQTDRQLIRQGNKLFLKGSYAEAEVAYRKAVDKNPKNPQAQYNLGNSLLAQGKDSLSVQFYEAATKLESSPYRKAKAFHNIGVVFQGRKMYSDAISVYKSALRLNPSDNETRYNLELCKRQQKKQQQNQKNQKQQNKKDKNNKNNKDKNKQKQDQNKQKQDKQNKQQQDKPKMSKDNAEQLLNAAMQQEKNTQERLKKAMQQPSRRRLEKNW
jgi:tetratricopeptide (TPR) repeat protein